MPSRLRPDDNGGVYRLDATDIVARIIIESHDFGSQGRLPIANQRHGEREYLTADCWAVYDPVGVKGSNLYAFVVGKRGDGHDRSEVRDFGIANQSNAGIGGDNLDMETGYAVRDIVQHSPNRRVCPRRARYQWGA